MPGDLTGRPWWQAAVLGEDLLAPDAALMGARAILASGCLVGLLLFGLFPGYELLLAVANEVFPAHLFQHVTQ